MGRDKRAHPRVKLIKWPAKVLIEDETIEAVTRNISVTGAFLYYIQSHGYDLPFRSDEQVGLILEPPGRAPLRICAEVVWSDVLNSDEKTTVLGAGLRFTDVSYEDRQFLHDFIAKSTRNKSLRNGNVK